MPHTNLLLSRRSLLINSAAVMGLATLLNVSLGVGVGRAAEPKRGGTLKIGLSGGSASDQLDPAFAGPNPTRLLPRQWGDTLTALGADRLITGRIAQTIASDESATVWTFRIRSGVKFHDGSILTPEDVRQTYLRHSDAASKSAALPLFAAFDTIEATADEVIIRLKEPNADLPYLLTDYHLPIQPKGGYDNPEAAIGTGPYRLVEADPGVRYYMERHTEDWDQNRGFYDAVEILLLNDGTLRGAALQSGQVHMINGVDPKIAPDLDAMAGVNVVSTISRTHYFWPAMIDHKPFDNKDLILALKYAVDREEILEKVLGGYGKIGNDVPVNETYPLYAGDLPQRSFDLAKARAHYLASGHDGSPLQLYCSGNTLFPGAMDMAALFQASCLKAGIPLEVVRVPDEGYWTEIWLKKSFITNFNLGRAVQDQQYGVFYGSGAVWNATHFANAALDAALKEGKAEKDPEKRTKIYQDIARIVHEEGSVIIPVFADIINAHRDEVQGWQGIPDDELMGGLAPSLTWFA